MQQNTLKNIVKMALEEDLGQGGDITSRLTVSESLEGEMVFLARQGMVVAGCAVPEAVYNAIDPTVNVSLKTKDGEEVQAGTALAIVRGKARSLLAGERVALNLMQRACGVATLTRAYVKAVSGTDAIILDTRKTMPGLRALDKHAVVMGGGQNHRFGLYDAVLIKDNHIALCGDVAKAIRRAREGTALPVIVECDTLQQVQQALAAKPDRILLDNMSPDRLREAVTLANKAVPLEASGGVTLANIRAIAETGVDYISVGAITHSAPAADIAADVKLEM